MDHNILVIQTAFIGDVILTTPLLQAIKNIHPDAEIDVIVVPNSKNVLENNPNINNIIEYDKRGKDKGFFNFISLAKELRKRKYKSVIIPHRSMRSAVLALLTGSKTRIGFDKSSGSFLYTNSIAYQSTLHEVERNLNLLQDIDSKIINSSGPRVYPDENDYSVVENHLENLSDTRALVAVAPGSVWNTKKWPQNHYRELVKGLINKNLNVILIGGPDDKNLCSDIMGNSDRRNVLNLAGKLSLRQSAAVLTKCKTLVCNDSGTLHLGVAVNTKVIAIFGPTVPAFGFYPYGSGHTVIEHKGLNCRPCAIHGSKKCPIGTHVCMTELEPQMVLDTLLNVIEVNK